MSNPRNLPAHAVQSAAKLAPEQYPYYQRRMRTIRLLRWVRSLGDSLGASRWLPAALVSALLFVVTLLVGIVLPWGLGVQFVLALTVAAGVFGLLMGMMYVPADRVLNGEFRALDGVLPQLREAWLKHLEEESKAREAERARLAEQRRREAEERERQAKLDWEAAAARRQQTLRGSGTAVCMFDNQTDTPALVKLIGPVEESVNVATGSVGTIAGVPAGRYVIKVRYGTSELNYTFTEGDPFSLQDHALCKITLHKVVGGNYGSRSIGKGSF